MYSAKKSTRLYAFISIGLISTFVWLFGGAHAKWFSAAMTTDQWTGFIQWIFGTYATSEALRYGAESLGVRSKMEGPEPKPTESKP